MTTKGEMLRIANVPWRTH